LEKTRRGKKKVRLDLHELWGVSSPKADQYGRRRSGETKVDSGLCLKTRA